MITRSVFPDTSGGGAGVMKVPTADESQMETVLCDKCGLDTGVSVNRKLCTFEVTVLCGLCGGDQKSNENDLGQ